MAETAANVICTVCDGSPDFDCTFPECPFGGTPLRDPHWRSGSSDGQPRGEPVEAVPTLDATKESELVKVASLMGEAMQADSEYLRAQRKLDAEYGAKKNRISLEASNLHSTTESETVREMLRSVFERWGR